MQSNEHRRNWRGPGAFALTSALLVVCAAGCHRQASRPQAEREPAESEVAPLAGARADQGGYAFTQAEKAAVEEFLRRHPDLRMATDGDRRGTHSGDGDVRGLYGVYHPYFVRGDLNDDGVLDFVLAFVHRSRPSGSPWFSVVVFSGRGGEQGFSAGTFLEREISLARGDLSIDRDAILVTPDLSDEGVRRYRWDPVHRSYVFVRDREEEDDAPVATQT